MTTSDFAPRLKNRFEQLDRLLTECRWLWGVQPFKEARPQWCDELPGLAHTLLGLSDADLAEMSANSRRLMRLLAYHAPETAPLEALCCLPAHPSTSLNDSGPRMQWHIPGRKWNQIAAFAGAIGPVHTPVLEWCGGKGHLGRLLASQWDIPLLSVERDETLCREGQQLAHRFNLPQNFMAADVYTPDVTACLSGRHVVALHACGHLHRTLIRRAVQMKVPALDIVPCCYHLGQTGIYRASWPGAQLELTQDDVRIAVTHTATSALREIKRRDRDMAWKLGYDQLRRDISGEDRYRSMKPVESRWLKLGFEGYCRQLAARESLALSGEVDWQHYERMGWARQRDVMRLSLVRQAFRRALEIWLVLDRALYLCEEGYEVSVGTFCAESVTPRNILLSARLG